MRARRTCISTKKIIFLFLQLRGVARRGGAETATFFSDVGSILTEHQRRAVWKRGNEEAQHHHTVLAHAMMQQQDARRRAGRGGGFTALFLQGHRNGVSGRLDSVCQQSICVILVIAFCFLVLIGSAAVELLAAPPARGTLSE